MARGSWLAARGSRLGAHVSGLGARGSGLAAQNIGDCCGSRLRVNNVILIYTQ